jgi:two-component system response regulator FlrC
VTGGSRKLAAERLGISPRTLRYKLQQLKAAGVTVPRLLSEEFAAVSTP